MVQLVKHLPAVQETQVQSLGWEDPLGKEMATRSNILAWKNPMDRGAWATRVHGTAKSQMTEHHHHTNGNQPYSTGNCTQGAGVTLRGYRYTYSCFSLLYTRNSHNTLLWVL